MSELEVRYEQIMKRNRDLRMELLMYAEELDSQSDKIDPHEVSNKLIRLLTKNSPKE